MNYKLPEYFQKHREDFITLTRQYLAEAVRAFERTPYGTNNKDYWAEKVDRLGEWHNRFTIDIENEKNSL